MKYLIILDLSTNTAIIEDDPAIDDEDFNYQDYIYNTYGNIDSHFMIAENIDIKSQTY